MHKEAAIPFFAPLSLSIAARFISRTLGLETCGISGFLEDCIAFQKKLKGALVISHIAFCLLCIWKRLGFGSM
jgi:hypothetical protein